MTSWRNRAERLARDLAGRGAIRDPAWHAVFAATPRHMFVPRFYTMDDLNQPRTLVRGDNPATRHQWLDAVYQDQVLITRYEVVDTMPDGQEARVAASSASMPYVVAVMLHRLDVRDGHRVLEIGTGTGYNAALLATRLGGEDVTSVELDERSAAEAAERLATAGHHPSLVVGDGAVGVPDRAPYDRIIATCAISQIPIAWVRQLAPNGRIVAPLTFGSALAVLDRTDEGGLVGRIDPEPVSFITMRTTGYQPRPVKVRRPEGVPHRGLTALDPRLVDPLGHAYDLQLWLALHLPGSANLALTCSDDGTPDGIILAGADSYVDVGYQPTRPGTWPVNQLGTRRLWDTVESAYAAYHRQDKPARDRLGITGNVDGEQYVWLDDPDGPYAWPMPG
ncbi:MAG: methyltransferase domain-containing protein [Micromonosporaceae bacterium]|nr:methyltransferase domain-containing protein [Micromonosporaceae bacterium]